MKGLQDIPSLTQLQNAYRILQTASSEVREEELALWAQWARFDPRLGEQWISHVQKHWKTILPMLLNTHLLQQPWPQAAGPLLEQVPLSVGFSPTERKAFRHWYTCVMTQIPRAQGELFFIGLRAFAGAAMQQDVLLTLKLYERWGFFCRDLLFNKATSTAQATTLSRPARHAILTQLLKTQKTIRVKDYILASGGAISLRQAQLDLAQRKGVTKVGKTKGCFYSG